MRDVLAIYFLTFGIKIVAYIFSGYAVLIADSMHSVVDIILILIVVISQRISEKAADESHPFGHELAKNLASLIVAVSFITIISFELFKEGVRVILNPSTHTNTDLAIACESLVLLLLILAAFVSSRRSGILNRTLLFESFNDSLSTVSAIAGIYLSTLYPLADGFATIAVAILIALNSVKLIRENVRFLMAHSPPNSFYDEVERVCKGIEDVKDVHDMLGVYIGENSIHLDLHVTVDGDMRVSDVDKLSEKIAAKLKEEIPEIKHVTIHFCPHKGEKRKFVF